MKKNLLYILTIFTFSTLFITFSSCNSDDDDKQDEKNTEKLIIGKWQPTKAHGENVEDDYLFSCMKDDVMEINSDKTVTYDENGTFYGINQTESLYPSKSTWSVSYESTLWKNWVINFKGDGVFFFADNFEIVKVDNNTLILNNGFEYEFKRIN